MEATKEIHLAELPLWVHDKLAPRLTITSDNGDYPDGEKPSPEKIADALSRIPKWTPYLDGWLPVLMAVHTVYPDGTGIKLIEDWSPGYEGEVAKKFKSFKGEGVNIGTLFYLAQQYGWKPKREYTRGKPSQNTNNDDLPFPFRQYVCEDGGILDAWIDYYGDDWVFATGFETWHYWTGTHWAKDDKRKVHRQIQRLIDTMNKAVREELKKVNKGKDASDKEKERLAILKGYKNATKRTKARVNSVEAMAQNEKAIAGDELNAGNVLNLQNGTLDLDTLELMSHDKYDYLAYCLPYEYDPVSLCPRWELFMNEVLVEEENPIPDESLIQLFQELLGYSLTTDTQHDAMAWLSGDGNNGKSVAIKTLYNLLGPMATGVDFHTLGAPGNYDLSKLPGKRVIFSTESKRGGRVAEGWIKRIVSGELISTRPIYGHPMDFLSISKIWWAMNDKPIIRDSSDAIWRRLRLIPFNRTFTEDEQDTALDLKLEKELSGILNWTLEGLQRLRKNGKFTKSKQAVKANEELKHESNPVKQWREEETVFTEPNVVKDKEFVTSASTLYENYKSWCKTNGREAFNSTNFGIELKRLPGVKYSKGAYVKYNLELKWIV